MSLLPFSLDIDLVISPEWSSPWTKEASGLGGVNKALGSAGPKWRGAVKDFFTFIYTNFYKMQNYSDIKQVGGCLEPR